ncbi:MAG: PKD domain-containing protein [Acidobacteria bacterium]|nr:PKD domain-containing protein [Acidobacteriota bacterium]
MTTSRHFRTLVFLLAGASALTACTSKPDTVKATGPSELGLSLQVLATPDVLSTDGMSTAQIVVTARGPNSELKPGVPLRADILVGGAVVDYGSLSAKSGSTGADGRATFIYTAPPGGLSGNADARNMIQVAFTPLSGDYSNAVERAVSIRLVPLGTIVFPGQPIANFSWRPNEPYELEDVTLDAGLSKDCPLTAAAATDCYDTPSLTYEWNLDDRNIVLRGRVIKYQFPRFGDYFVKLTVTNALGNRVSVTKQIDVLARPRS